MGAKPFHWHLKRVDPREEALIDSLYQLFPLGEYQREVAFKWGETLAKVLGGDLRVVVERVTVESFEAFHHSLPETGLLVLLSATPSTQKALLEIDTALAFHAINKLLGGEAIPAPRPLTEAEQGVIQFIVLSLLQEWNAWQKEGPALRFDRFCFQAEALPSLLPTPHGTFALISLQLGWGKVSGVVRLALPAPLLEKRPTVGEGARALLRKRWEAWRDLRTTLWGEAGRTTVTAAELGAIEAGDVLLFDECELSLAGKHLQGKAPLRVGWGTEGGFVSDIESSPGSIHCIVKGMHHGT